MNVVYCDRAIIQRDTKVREEARQAALESAVEKLQSSTFLRDDRVAETVAACIALVRSLGTPSAGDKGEMCTTCGGSGRLMGSGPPDHWTAPCPDCRNGKVNI